MNTTRPSIFSLSNKVTINEENKIKHGELYTPFSLIQEMLSLLPLELFQKREYKWLDTSCGNGNFLKVLYNKLLSQDKQERTDTFEIQKEIWHTRIYGNDIREENIHELQVSIRNETEYEGATPNLQCYDFLSDNLTFPTNPTGKFHVIVGNPPYNSGGTFKVPTNKSLPKKNDGRAIWKEFVRKSLSLLYKDGYLVLFLPTLWLKPDKSKTYELLNQYKIHYLKTYSTTETHRLFGYNAQTPTCFFVLQKTRYHTNTSKRSLSLYDSIYQEYITHTFTMSHPIPMNYPSILHRLSSFLKRYGTFSTIVKTNMPPKNISLSLEANSETHPYPNIRSCVLEPYVREGEPRKRTSLLIEYSNKELKYSGERKIVLAHKMYGFAYYDRNGTYGISNRDNYVLCGDYTDSEFQLLIHYFNSKLLFFLMDTTRYRMRYLEKYFFHFIPDITKMKSVQTYIQERNHNVSQPPPNTFFYSLFELNSQEIEYIENYYPAYTKYDIFRLST